MSDELSSAQRKSLETQIAMVKALGAVPDVVKHDTRFDNEIALKAPSSAMDKVRAIVEEHLGEATKPKGDPVPPELGGRAMIEAFGGLRPDQTLYEKELAEGLFVYVAFWPWGGGGTNTVKIGVFTV
jgi:hypothetical protein